MTILQMLRHPWRTFKVKFSRFCLWVIYYWCPLELKKVIDEESMKRAQTIAQEIIMKYLDKQGFLHCYVCPSRHGLVRRTVEKEGKRFEAYFCPGHQSMVKPLEESAAVGAGQRR